MNDTSYKIIKGFSRYKINNIGIIRRVKDNKEIKQGFNKHYFHVTIINDDGIRKTIDIHKLVALNFINNPNPLLYNCINHKDENKLNNNVNNLEWCDIIYNNNYGSKIERTSKSNSKIIFLYDINCNELQYESLSIVANKYNTTVANISFCIKTIYLFQNKFIISKVKIDNDTINYIFKFREKRKPTIEERKEFVNKLKDNGIECYIRIRNNSNNLHIPIIINSKN